MIYLDNSATTPLSLSAKQFIINTLDTFGNPSSLHQEGIQANKLISHARKSVAKFINADTDDIIFTCSGAASNTLAIKGYVAKHNCVLFYSPLLHKSALECIESLHYNKEILNVDSQGFIDIDNLESRMNPLKYPPFVVIEYANSEIGTIQNVKRIIEITHKYNGIVYLDCTGSISTITLDVKDLDVDMAGFSAHKIGALKGCAVLYKKKHIQLEPLVYGTQEQGLMGGTQNTLGIATLGYVVENYNYSSNSSLVSFPLKLILIHECISSLFILIATRVEDGCKLPLLQAEPVETSIPFISNSIISDSPSTPLKHIYKLCGNRLSPIGAPII